MEKVLIALSNALNLDATELTALKNGDTWLEDEIAAKVASLIPETLKVVKDAQHKRGIREANESIEKAIKASGFEITAELKTAKAVELIDAFGSWKAASAASSTELNEESAASNPIVKELRKKWLLVAEARNTELEQSFNAFKKGVEIEKVKGIAQREAERILVEKNAILEVPSADITKAQRLATFNNLLPYGSMKLNDKGQPIMIDDKGEELQDDFGKPITFEMKVVELNKNLFGFAKQDPSKGSPNPNPSQTGGHAYSFSSVDDFNEAMRNEPDGKKRLDMQKAFYAKDNKE